MLNHTIQQVLKRFGRDKKPGKVSLGGTRRARPRTLTAENFAATRQLAIFALQKGFASEWRQRSIDAFHTPGACA